MNPFFEHMNGVLDDVEARMSKRIGQALPAGTADRRRDYAARADFDRVVTGEARDFWDLDLPHELQHDCEQYIPLFAALWKATKLAGATPAQRWAVVEREIRQQAFLYAERRAEWRRDGCPR